MVVRIAGALSAIPSELAPIVGREDALRSLAVALEDPPRALAISGPIGVGKSRLVCEFAARRAAAGARVALVDLASVARFDDALALVLATLEDDRSPVDDALALLVLDHCDALDRCDALVAALRARFAQAQIVTVSRARRIASPAFELTPLRTTAGADGPSDAERLLCALMDRGVSHRHERGEHTAAAAVASEGLPGVIERMAERANTLSVEQMVERMHEILASSGALERALDGSWEALDAGARDALSCCLAFSGSFSLEAADAVLRTDERAQPLRAIQALRDGSILALAADDSPTERRFVLLAPYRLLAMRCGAFDTVARARERHARHFIDRGEAQDADAESRRSPAALAWMQRERANLLAAVEHALLLGGEPALAARGALMLQRTRTGRDAARFHELASRALAPLDEASAPELRCDLLRARANTARLLGRHRDALSDFDAAGSIAASIGDRRRLGRTLIDAAATHSDAEALDDAERCFHEGLAHATAVGDPA
jgi:hypothetical protein